MRRIALALALLGAAAAGCGGSTPNNQGGARGVAEGTFTVMVQNGQDGNTSLAITGGYVTSVPPGIDCGVAPHTACSATFPADSTVVLTATPVGTGINFFEWSGDCLGDGSQTGGPGFGICSLTGKADKYVLARFGTPADRGSHPNWSASADHAAQYRSFALQCNACHGMNWQGLAIAPSCFACHNLDKREAGRVEDPPSTDGHFGATGAFGDHTTGWSSSCTRCHTNQGFQDYAGVDGTPNYLDGTFKPTNQLTTTTVACETFDNGDGTFGNCNPLAYEYGPLTCKTCHNAKTDPVKSGITQILFPSTKQVTTDRATALCGQCHQGRESTTSINAAIGTMGLDAQPLLNSSGVAAGFTNPHYLGAAATLFGSDAAGWAQYPGKGYTGTNTHAGTEGSCVSCHQPHTGDHVGLVSATTCGRCHTKADGTPVTNYAELEAARMVGFEGDIDGDGNATESIKDEILGLEATVYAAMQAYATEVLAAPITYTANYPYYMNAGGTAYKTFSPRLLRAAFNYKWAHAEPGAWAHNPRYVIEILFDTIEDLNDGLVLAGKTPVAFAGSRMFAGMGGHFDANSEAFRHWDEDGAVSSSCAKCHAGEKGLESFLATGTAVATAPVGAMQCTTCHAVQPGGTMAALQTSTDTGLSTLAFVSGKQVTTDNVTDLCGKCHGGRESTTSINTVVGTAGLDAQIATAGVSFKNPHYLGAAATLFGADAAGWAQYPNKIYTATNTHAGQGSCTSCHDAHNGQLPADADMAATCGSCHIDETTGVAVASFLELQESRQFGFEGDIDGDTLEESLKDEIEGLETTLYAAIQAYATDVVGQGVEYNGASHPYFFQEGTTTAFKKFTPRLMRAAFNYKWAHAEPGAWAHNPRYAIEILFDAIVDLKAGMVAKRTAGGMAAADAQAEVDVLVPFYGFRSFNGHFGGARAAAPYRAFIYSASVVSAAGQPVSSNQGGFGGAACYQCHGGATGVVEYLADPVAPVFSKKKVTGFECSTCHVNAADMKGIRSDVEDLYFPPQKPAAEQTVLDAATVFTTPADRVCATCHSGREGTLSVDAKIGDTGDTEWVLSFSNPHYLGAAGVLLGTDAQMMYEYAGKTYAGSSNGSCVACHDPKATKHTFEAGAGDPTDKANIDALKTTLKSAILTYSQTADNAVCYKSTSHPYWFLDDGALPSNGTCEADETTGATLNPKALRAAVNHKWAAAEHGAYAHNYVYACQALYDSLVDLGATPPAVTCGGTRP